MLAEYIQYLNKISKDSDFSEKAIAYLMPLMASDEQTNEYCKGLLEVIMQHITYEQGANHWHTNR